MTTIAEKARRVMNTEFRGTTLTLTQPDDWHFHGRDGEMLRLVLSHLVRRYGRAGFMPNLKDNPVTTVAKALEYRSRILAARPEGSHFEPLMMLYLTDNTSPDEIDRAADSGIVIAVKYYPAGATTNSDAGVTSIEKVYPVLERMQKRNMPLCIHGEVTDPRVDVFDREMMFIKTQFPFIRDVSGLKIVLEHITTKEAVQLIHREQADGHPTVATITAHHLLLNRNALFAGGSRPHHYCLPLLKREVHRQALLDAATSGDPFFFLGSDSAPHAKWDKESACGCAGCYTTHASIELYAEAFEERGALEKLEGFASFYGADFYGLPRNLSKITLVKEPWLVPKRYSLGDGNLYLLGDGDLLVPLRAGELVQWKLK